MEPAATSIIKIEWDLLQNSQCYLTFAAAPPAKLEKEMMVWSLPLLLREYMYKGGLASLTKDPNDL